MRDFTQIFALGRKAKVAIVSAVLAFILPCGVNAATEMFGDTIFFEDFGTGCGAYKSFEAAGLGTMSTISSLYKSYDAATTKYSFYGGDYLILDNTERIRNLSGLKNPKSGKSATNSYLVSDFSDHTHMVNSSQTASKSCGASSSTNGRYLLINGSTEAGSVFKRRINELCKNSQFQFSCWAARAHATDYAKNWADCQFQFEFWAEDPGDAIIVSGDGTSLVPGAMNAVYKSEADKTAGTETQVKLLGKTDVFTLKKFPAETAKGTKTVTYQSTTATNKFPVYKSSTQALYAYVDSVGVYHKTTPSATPITSSTTFAEGGEIIESSSQVQPVYAKSCKSGSTADWVYTDGTNYVDYNGSSYYACTYGGVDGDTIMHTSTTKSVSGYEQLQIKVKTTGGDYYPLYTYTHTDGTVDYLVKNGVSYYKVTFGVTYASFVPVWVLDATSTIATDETVVPSTDQSTVYTVKVTYDKEEEYTYEVVQSRWEELKAQFFLEGQDYVYLVLRNAVGNNTANDFAIDDIAFIPHNEFNLTVATGSGAQTTACKDGMVTIEATFNFEDDKKAVIAEYITSFGFFFEGYNASTMTWTRLGSGMPMKVQSLDSKLELSIPLNEYNLYSEFRLSSSYTVEGFAGKCITFATPNSAAEQIKGVPQFIIKGDDKCVEEADAGDGSMANFVIVNTSNRSSGETNGWKVRIKQPDGSYKWLVPEKITCP